MLTCTLLLSTVVISFLAGVVIFDFHVTPSFVVGSTVVIGATWLYNQPAPTIVSHTPGMVQSGASSPLLHNSSRSSSPLPTSYHTTETAAIDSPHGLHINIQDSNHNLARPRGEWRNRTGHVPQTPDIVVGFDGHAHTPQLGALEE